jgi:2',3'-cyclic-nucleotide 2'-phosphodiesterase (5'-nucleotidase family)
MVKLKNSALVLKCFGLLLTFFILFSCGEQKYYVTKIEGKKIGITETPSETPEIENFIKPYRENIDKDLNQILAYNPETLDKSKGEWQTNIGNFLADITFNKSNTILMSRENKSVDICLLNNGGIRTVIPKGNVTARNAYEVMPFENAAVVIALKGTQVMEMVNYITSEKKPHPLKGLTFTIDKNNTPKNILVQNKPLENDKIYYVVTSDYLANGGDNMVFFKQPIQRYDVDYKLRNIMIDYFKEVDTLKFDNSIRITKE